MGVADQKHVSGNVCLNMFCSQKRNELYRMQQLEIAQNRAEGNLMVLSLDKASVMSLHPRPETTGVWKRVKTHTDGYQSLSCPLRSISIRRDHISDTSFRKLSNTHPDHFHSCNMCFYPEFHFICRSD